jgi:hypothetical protein
MLLAFLRDAQAAVTLVTMWMWMSMSDRRRPGSSTPLQRGVSDHGHFAWSLTPQDCCWRALGQWRDQAGGTDRRPTTTACNLRGESRLSSALAARESLAATWRIP